MKSIFTDKTLTPTSAELEKAIEEIFPIRQNLEIFITKTALLTVAGYQTLNLKNQNHD